MLPYSEHPIFYNHSIYLSAEQKSNPYGVLVRFFQDHRLVDLRIHLSQVSEICLTSDEPPFDEGVKRSDLLHYQQQMEIVLEAAFLVAQLNENKDPDNE